MTVEELWNEYSNLYSFEEGSPEYLIDKEDFIKAVREFTELKCKETARNVRHSACQIAAYCREDLNSIERNIMNIQDKDIIPEL